MNYLVEDNTVCNNNEELTYYEYIRWIKANSERVKHVPREILENKAKDGDIFSAAWGKFFEWIEDDSFEYTDFVSFLPFTEDEKKAVKGKFITFFFPSMVLCCMQNNPPLSSFSVERFFEPEPESEIKPSSRLTVQDVQSFCFNYCCQGRRSESIVRFFNALMVDVKSKGSLLGLSARCIFLLPNKASSKLDIGNVGIDLTPYVKKDEQGGSIEVTLINGEFHERGKVSFVVTKERVVYHLFQLEYERCVNSRSPEAIKFRLTLKIEALLKFRKEFGAEIFFGVESFLKEKLENEKGRDVVDVIAKMAENKFDMSDCDTSYCDSSVIADVKALLDDFEHRKITQAPKQSFFCCSAPNRKRKGVSPAAMESVLRYLLGEGQASDVVLPPLLQPVAERFSSERGRSLFVYPKGQELSVLV